MERKQQQQQQLEWNYNYVDFGCQNQAQHCQLAV